MATPVELTAQVAELTARVAVLEKIVASLVTPPTTK